MESDYLKFYRPVRKYIKVKYGIKDAELDLLLFLKSERFFTYKDFHTYNKILPWDNNRFAKLVKDGWIEVYRDAPKNWKPGRIKYVYRLTHKSKKMIEVLYNYLEGKNLPVTKSANPLLKVKGSFSERVHKNFIASLNYFNRHQQSPES